MSVVGFDFGNSYCTIAVAQKGGIDVIVNEVSSRQTPCMVAFGEKERYIGEPALTQYLRNIKNTVSNIKRILGRKWSEPELQQELKSLPFKAVELPNNEVGIEVMYCGERKVFTPIQITAMILQKLKSITEIATEKGCCDVVIGVPGFWTDHQRRAMLDASKVAGLNCLRLLNETTASALGYGIYKTNLSETEPIHVMFVDMGHSTTTVSIVEFLKGKLKVIASAYDRNLGGRDFDQILVNHFIEEIKAKYKIDIRTNQKALIRLEVSCEKLKKMLNTVPEAPINVDSIMNDIDVKGLMKKGEFESMVQPLLERFLEPVKKVLADSGFTTEKLTAIEITGGATRLIAVQQKLQEFMKREISKTLNFEEAVARGCALQCAILSPVFKVRDFAISDISMYPVKVSWRSPDAMVVDESKDSAEIFSKNNVLPCPKMITLHKTEPFEVVAEYSDPSLLPPGTPSFIGKWAIPTIPPTKEETPKIRVKVKLDINGVVNVESAEMSETLEEPVTAEKPATPQETTPTSPETKPEEKKPEDIKKEEEAKKKKVRRVELGVTGFTSFLPTKELQLLAEEENRMASQDKLANETAEKKNAVETYVYDMRGKINDALSEYSSETEKLNLSRLLESTESWLYGEGEDVTKSVYASRLEELKRLGDPIVRRKFENENRYDALSNIKKTVEQYRLSATTEDPKYDHISQEDKNKVVQECNATEKFISENMMKQERLPKHSNPVITVADIAKKQQELARFCQTILNKPKPLPKPEPKPEEKKEEAKPEEAKAEGKPQNSSGPKNPNEMDLD